MKYLLVGANGFLSKNFQSYLKKQKKIFKKISSKKIDLTSPISSKSLEKYKGKFYVVFFSALTPDKGKGYKTFFDNIEIAKNFINNINKEIIEHFVYISSDAVYSQKEILVTEETHTSPDDLYGFMHLSRENIFKDYIANTENITILRPTLIYGNGDTHNSYGPNRFIKQLKNDGIINIFGKGLDERDHISVNDVSKAIYNSCEKKITGIINLVTGKSSSFKEVANLVRKYHGPNCKINFIKNNNKKSIRKYNSKKIFNIIGKPIEINQGIKNYFKIK